MNNCIFIICKLANLVTIPASGGLCIIWTRVWDRWKAAHAAKKPKPHPILFSLDFWGRIQRLKVTLSGSCGPGLLGIWGPGQQAAAPRCCHPRLTWWYGTSLNIPLPSESIALEEKGCCMGLPPGTSPHLCIIMVVRLFYSISCCIHWTSERVKTKGSGSIRAFTLQAWH